MFSNQLNSSFTLFETEPLNFDEFEDLAPCDIFANYAPLNMEPMPQLTLPSREAYKPFFSMEEDIDFFFGDDSIPKSYEDSSINDSTQPISNKQSQSAKKLMDDLDFIDQPLLPKQSKKQLKLDMEAENKDEKRRRKNKI